MKWISHRGNLEGKKPELENTPPYIMAALRSGFDVEIDVWFNGGWFLGHDKPEYMTDLRFLLTPNLWCHAKNLDALSLLLFHKIHCFWHENDLATLTSQHYIWTFPNKPLTKRSIAVLPTGILPVWKNAAGVCSDIVAKLRD